MSEEILAKANATIARYLGISSNVTVNSDEFTKITVSQVFGEIWNRPGLEWRDRSLITLTTLIVQGHVQEMKYHMRGARRLGFTLQQLEEMCLHLGYYVGFLAAQTAIRTARAVFAESEPQQECGKL